MTWNSGNSGTGTLLDELESTIRALLPTGWRLTSLRESGCSDLSATAVFELSAPDGATARIAVPIEESLEPRDVPGFLKPLERTDKCAVDTVVVTAPFVSPMTRDRLAERKVGWFDITGNLRLNLDRPSVFFDRVGASRNPFPEQADRRQKSLRGAASARIVRSLLVCELPVGVRELAIKAGTGVATSARVLDLLVREGVIDRSDLGEVIAVRKRALINRWTNDYGLMTSNRVTPMLAPRGVDNALARLAKINETYVVTGSAAARAYLPNGKLPVAPVIFLTIYTTDLTALAREIGARKVERGANILLVRPFDDIVITGARTISDVNYAAPEQVIADLLTGQGRSTEEAGQLINVLTSHDPGWNL